MDTVSQLALMLGASWASGLNLYIAVLTLGLMQSFGWIALPGGLEALGSPIVLITAFALYAVEFIADKVPGVSALWDALHTFIRIPAGAVLAAATVSGLEPQWVVAAALAGGFVAAGTHAAKAGSRAAFTLDPFTAIAASFVGDATVVAGLWVAVQYPIVFLVLLLLFAALLVWLLPKLFRAIGRVLRWRRA
jgi:hypothetical protein